MRPIACVALLVLLLVALTDASSSFRQNAPKKRNDGGAAEGILPIAEPPSILDESPDNVHSIYKQELEGIVRTPFVPLFDGNFGSSSSSSRIGGGSPDAWPQEGHDSQRRHSSTSIGPLSTNYTTVFQNPASSNSIVSPTVSSDSVVYFASNYPVLYALQEVYVPSGYGALSVFWTGEYLDSSAGSPALIDSTGVYSSASSVLLIPDANRGLNCEGGGSCVWPVSASAGSPLSAGFSACSGGGGVRSSPLYDVVTGLIIFSCSGSLSSALYAVSFSPSNGGGLTLVWQFAGVEGANFGWSSSQALSSDGSMIYAVSSDCNVYAINISNGAQVWCTAPRTPKLCPEEPTSAPSVGSYGLLYLGLLVLGEPAGQGFVAIREGDGSVAWFVDSGDVRGSAAIGADGAVYFVSAAGTLWAVNGETGSTICTLALPGPSSATPILDGAGTLFVGWEGGMVAFNTSRGGEGAAAILWSYSVTGGVNSSAALGPDGTLYFAGATDFTFYGILSAPVPPTNSSGGNSASAISTQTIIIIGAAVGGVIGLLLAGAAIRQWCCLVGSGGGGRKGGGKGANGAGNTSFLQARKSNHRRGGREGKSGEVEEEADAIENDARGASSTYAALRATQVSSRSIPEEGGGGEEWEQGDESAGIEATLLSKKTKGRATLGSKRGAGKGQN